MPMVKLAFFLKTSNFIERFTPMKNLLIKLPSLLRNFYVITLAVFMLWMLFIDSNDIIAQYQLNNKLKNLEEEKAYYLQKIDEVKKDREELLSNAELLEKFAREKYLMRRKTEDLYVIVEKEED